MSTSCSKIPYSGIWTRSWPSPF